MQGGPLPAYLPQPLIPGQKSGVLPAPGIGAAVQGILVALHPGLVPVVHRGRAGEGIEEQRPQPQPGRRPPVFGRGEASRRPLTLALRHRLSGQEGEDPGRVVGAQKIHGAVEGGGGVVLPKLLHPLTKRRRIPAQKPVYGRRAEGVVHQPVGLPAQEIPPPPVVGDLVAAVLPHLADKHRVGLFLLHGPANLLDEVIRQLVGHIQPPTVGPGPEPVPHHGVPVPDDKRPVRVLPLVHRRQGLDAPPGVVFLRPAGEMIPIIIRRGLGLGRPQLRVKTVPVKISAHAAGVVEHPVQQQTHPALMGLAAQLPKILLRTQHGVHGPIVGGVIPMVGRSLENRVEIQRRHRQALQIVQLLRNAPEITAEKVAVTNFPLLVRQIVRGVLPAFVNGPFSHQPLRLRQATAAKAVWENLVAHALTEPFRRPGVLIHRQLPGAAASGKGHGLAASSGQGEVVPQQVRLLRGRHRAAPGAAARCQGHRPVKAGELRPEPHRPGTDVLLPGAEQGKRHFGAAQNGTEGVLTL